MLAWGFIMSLGYAAETFPSGEAFLKSDRARDTACLLTDVQMTSVNGLELQR
jgi:FixJ family two-component response regulator